MSVRFDTTSENLRITANLPSNTAYTVFNWMKVINVNAGTTRSFMTFRDQSAGQYHFARLNTGNDLQISGDRGATSAAISPQPTLTNWFCWAWVVNGTGANAAKFYWRQEQGSSWNSNTCTSGTWSAYTPTDLLIGVDGGNFDCERRYLRIWSAALSESELTSEFNSTTVVRTANLNRDIQLNDAATALTDYSGNGYNVGKNGTLSDGASEPNITSKKSRLMLMGIG